MMEFGNLIEVELIRSSRPEVFCNSGDSGTGVFL